MNIQLDAGDLNIHAVDGNINMKAERAINMETAVVRMKTKFFEAEVDGNWDEKVTGTNTKTGSTIDLN